MTALLASVLDHTSNGVVARITRQMGPSTERKKSRKRNWPIITEGLTKYTLEL
jgi:hypothetical protein